MRYWVFLDKRYDGPYTLDELMKLDGFSSDTPVCIEGEGEWVAAAKCPTIRRQWAAQPLPTPVVVAVSDNEAPSRGALLEGFLKRTVIHTGDYKAPKPPSSPSMNSLSATGGIFRPPKYNARNVYRPAPRRSFAASAARWVLATSLLAASIPTYVTFVRPWALEVLEKTAVFGIDFSDGLRQQAIDLYRFARAPRGKAKQELEAAEVKAKPQRTRRAKRTRLT
jgi:hypothetical protein